MRIPLTLAWVANQPWALREETYNLMRAILLRRDAGVRLSPEDLSAAIGERRERVECRLFCANSLEQLAAPAQAEQFAAATSGRAQGSVIAVLSVLGLISQRAQMVDDISGPGGTSVERLTARFRSALADSSVRAIVFDIDSPGGGVYGVEELADEILASRGQKPIVAVANSLAASAAYWIGSAADEMSVTPSGDVGSIGVYAAHEDISKQLEAQGVKVTLVSAGEFKTEGNEFQPLSEEAIAHMKTRVEEHMGTFVNAVAKGRGVTTAKVRKDFGQGRTVGARAAKAAGMVDRIETLDHAIRRVAGRGKRPAEPVTSSSAGLLEAEGAWVRETPPDHSAEYEAARSKARIL